MADDASAVATVATRVQAPLPYGLHGVALDMDDVASAPVLNGAAADLPACVVVLRDLVYYTTVRRAARGNDGGL